MEDPKRIALFSPVFSATDGTHGGITSVVLGLLHGRLGSGREVVLLVRADHTSWAMRASVPDNVRFFCIGKQRWPIEERIIQRWLDRNRPDVLITAGHRFNLIGIRAARRAGRRVVASVHNNLRYRLSTQSGLHRWRSAAAIRRTYPKADAIVCVSSGVASDLHQRLGGADVPIVTIPNPVLGAASSPAKEFAPHPWFARGASNPVVLAAGRLTPEKDFPTLLRAFKRVCATRSARLIIIGDGEERERLERMVMELGLEQAVDLPGFQTNPQAWMAKADLFVLSSASEGLGNVLIEAMAAGTPVVSTDCPSGGPAEILRDGELGPLVPVGDDKALGRAMINMLDAPVSSSDLQAATTPYHPDHVAARYLDTLRRSCGGNWHNRGEDN